MKRSEILKRARNLKGTKVVVEAIYPSGAFEFDKSIRTRIYEGILLTVETRRPKLAGMNLPRIFPDVLASITIGPGTFAIPGFSQGPRGWAAEIPAELIRRIGPPSDYDLRQILAGTRCRFDEPTTSTR